MIEKYIEKFEKLQQRKDKKLCIFILIFGFGWIFFLTSNYWFPDSGYGIEPTPLYENKVLGDRKICLTRWQYDPEGNIMEAEFTINDETLDGKSEYRYTAQTNTGRSLKTKVVSGDSDFSVIRIENVPKRWGEISIHIITEREESGADSELKEISAKFYTRKKEVEIVKELPEKETETYYRQHIDNLIVHQEEMIKEDQNEIEKYKEKQIERAEKILEWQKEMTYLTESEKKDAENLISQAQKEICNFEDEQKKLSEQIKDCNEKIEKLNQKKEGK